MNKDTLEILQNMMHRENPYVEMYKQAAAIIKNRTDPTQEIRLRLLTDVAGKDKRRYNKPTCDEIAAIIPDDDNIAHCTRDIVVEYTGMK